MMKEIEDIDTESIENICEFYKKINKKKIVIKSILVTISVIIAYIVSVEAGTRGYIRWLENMKYTKYELCEEELKDLRNYFAIGIKEYFTKTVFFLSENTYNKDKKKFKLETSVYTDSQVEQFNQLLFNSSAEDARKVALKYGITESNPATSDWVVTHPKEALEIVYSDESMKELYSEEIIEKLREYYR